jgi:beta-lactamase class A
MTIHSISRRVMMLATGALPLAACHRFADDARPFADLERTFAGRLGVAALDVETGNSIRYRADERFPMCSTFKVLAVASVLARVDRGQDRLDRWITYGPEDLLQYAPVTRAHVKDGGMTLGALCEAAIEVSDNTAANLVLKQLGGPAGLTRWIASLGDSKTRLDRWEPSLNTAIPGDERDTTAPQAMLDDFRRIVLGDVLSAASRAAMRSWLISCTTGNDLIRSRVPHGWTVGDKTGRCGNGTVADVAFIVQPDGKQLLIAVYYTGSRARDNERAAVVARAGEIAVKVLTSRANVQEH